MNTNMKKLMEIAGVPMDSSKVQKIITEDMDYNVGQLLDKADQILASLPPMDREELERLTDELARLNDSDNDIGVEGDRMVLDKMAEVSAFLNQRRR